MRRGSGLRKLMATTKERLSQLAELMRQDWDRRIAHDYRFWMSDGVENDDEMWNSGERDYQLLAAGLNADEFPVVLEAGCGVGRLLRACASRHRHVIGADVSAQALDLARRFLADQSNIELFLTNGIDLDSIENDSIDLVLCFGVLGVVPAAITAAYLIEFNRVLRPGGVVRAQVYLGSEQGAVQIDTLTPRSFAPDDFKNAVERAGFKLAGQREINLPFEASDREAGIFATMVSLQKQTSAESFESIEAALGVTETLPAGSFGGSRTEYLMAVSRATQHMEAGRLNDALATLEFAVSQYREAEIEIKEVLAELRRTLGASGSEPSVSDNANAVERSRNSEMILSTQDEPFLESNLRVLAERFPDVHTAVSGVNSDCSIVVQLTESGDPVVIVDGVPLDNPQKPRRAAEVWSERALINAKANNEIVLVGWGAGYAIEAISKASSAPVHIVIPDLRHFRAALGVRDMRAAFEQAASLTLSLQEFKERVLPFLPPDRAELLIHPPVQALSGSRVDEFRRAFLSRRGFDQLRPAIAVVGPMYGGSLPIAQYTVNALRSLKQRVYGYNLSEFFKTFNSFSNVLRDNRRVSVLQSQYVELLSSLIVESINERPVEIVICLAQAPLSPRALTELRERGIITAMWFVEDYRRFKTWKELARYFDYMFLIQDGEALREVEQAGAGKAVYLPVACDPIIHRPIEVSAEDRERYGSDLSFLGAGYNNRRQMFANLVSYDFKIWGNEWPSCVPFTTLVQEKGRRIEPEEYVKIFNSSKINLNLHSSMERDGVEPNGDFINPRTFELASCGAFQLVDNRTLLPPLFDDSELVTFSDRHDLIQKIDYYLAHPQERAAYAHAGRRRVLAEHTYEHRVKTMLDYIYADRYEQLRAKVENSPWPATLESAKDFPELRERLKSVYERGDEPTLGNLIADITTGKGSLTEIEQKLLFLHHIRSQIVYVTDLRAGKA
jgi:spore maturation protein CgeB